MLSLNRQPDLLFDPNIKLSPTTINPVGFLAAALAKRCSLKIQSRSAIAFRIKDDPNGNPTRK